MRDSRRPREFVEIAAIVWSVLGLLRLVQSIIVIDPLGTDFHGFYASAWSTRTGLGWPDLPPNANLNPPTFDALIVPLSFLPMPWAWRCWWLIGALSVAATLRLLHQHGCVPAHRWAWIVGALGLSVPAIQTWSHGQVAWLLLYPITRAWLSASATRAGLWLAPVIALKPPIAVIVLLLPSRTWAAAGASSAAICALHLAIAGVAPWQAWLTRAVGAVGLRAPANASYFGVAARAAFGIDPATPAPIAALPWVWWLGWIGCASFAVILAMRSTGTRRWIIALAAGTFLQPLGWVYYLVWWLGPLLSAWRGSPLAIVAAVLLTEPFLIFFSSLTAGTVFFPLSLSLCALGLVALGVSLHRSANERRTL